MYGAVGPVGDRDFGETTGGFKGVNEFRKTLTCRCRLGTRKILAREAINIMEQVHFIVYHGQVRVNRRGKYFYIGSEPRSVKCII